MDQSKQQATLHVGLHAYRLNNEGPQGCRETAFAELWSEKQKTQLLEYLLGNGNEPGEVSARDAQVAATVVQWLGTSVGHAFLEEVACKIAAQH